MFKITNKTGGELVCTNNNKTLRLKESESVVLNDSDITPYIKNLIIKGLLLCDEVVKNSKNKKER